MTDQTRKSILYLIAVILVASSLAILIRLAGYLPSSAQLSNFNLQSIFPSDPASPISQETTSEPGTTENQAFQGPFKVVKVRDGDTIELDNGMVIRYLYVDTPETVKPGEPVQCFGAEASTFNKNLLQDKLVRLVQDRDAKDQYGRDLRLVYLEGRDISRPEKSVNAELVKLGFAKAKFYSPNTTHKTTFQELEAAAKKEKLGLWSVCEEKKSPETPKN